MSLTIKNSTTIGKEQKKKLRKKQNDLIGQSWERTNNAYGHAPLFPIECRFCGNDMVVRHTRIILLKLTPLFGDGLGANIFTYKCAECASIARFFVPDNHEYLEMVKTQYRNGQDIYIPTDTEWTAEDNKIAAQLEALGYFGGRDG